MDGCLGYLVLFALVAVVVIYIACKIRAANVAAELRREDAELQRTHPEVWRQKELLKLDKERLARRRTGRGAGGGEGAGGRPGQAGEPGAEHRHWRGPLPVV